MDKPVPGRLSDKSRETIEMMLWGAVAIKQTPDQVLSKLPIALLSNDTQKLIRGFEFSAKNKAISEDLVRWFESRSVVIEAGDDILSAVIRRLVKERDARFLETNCFAVTHAMKHGDRNEVVRLLKGVLAELGEGEADQK
jgi:hypothetical protein